MAKIQNDNFHIAAGKPIDDKYLQADLTPYSNTAAVLARVPIAERHLGQKFLVLTTEYWFQSNITSLVAFASGGGVGYTPEDVANKVAGFGVLNDTLYPTTLAVNNHIIQLAWNLVGLNILLGDVEIDSENTFNVDFINMLTFSVTGQDLSFVTGAGFDRFIKLGETALSGGPGMVLQAGAGEGIAFYANTGNSGMEIFDNQFALYFNNSNGLLYNGIDWFLDLGPGGGYSLLIDFVTTFSVTQSSMFSLVPLLIDMVDDDEDTFKYGLTIKRNLQATDPEGGFGVGIDFWHPFLDAGAMTNISSIRSFQTGTSLGSNFHLDFWVLTQQVLRLTGGFGTNRVVFFPYDEMAASGGAGDDLLTISDNQIGYTGIIDFTGLDEAAASTGGINSTHFIYFDEDKSDFRAYNIDDGTFVNLTRPDVKTISASTYTILESDRNKFLRFTNVGGCTITWPVGLSLGHCTNIFRANGAGPLVIASAGTLESNGTTLNTAKTGASVIHIGSNIHVGQGALS